MNDNIFVYDFKKLRNNQFKSEKELSEFISENIFEFTKDVLDDVLIDFEIERRISRRINGLLFGRKNKRIDIYIKGQKKNYILELKNPCYRNENLSAIGQILNYGLNYDNCDLIIFSTLTNSLACCFFIVILITFTLHNVTHTLHNSQELSVILT